MYVEVSYLTAHGTIFGWASGATRMALTDLPAWLAEGEGKRLVYAIRPV
jgi:hypothetical protein